MKLIFTIFLWCTSTLTFSQDKIQIYTTKDGKRYSQTQRDSIERLGNFVGINETRDVGDTLYHFIFYYDKSFLLTPFQKLHQGKKFPQVKLKSPTGKWIDTGQLQDKLLFVYFWSTGLGWEEVSQLNQLADEFKDRVYFLSICSDGESEMLKALSSFQVKFEMAAEGEKVCADLGITNYPTTFIIDKSGIIKEVSEGVPVRTKKDKSFDDPDEEMKFIIYETNSKLLRDFLAGH